MDIAVATAVGGQIRDEHRVFDVVMMGATDARG